VHRILDCDRVIVYALHQKIYGKIVAESVSPGWTKAEGMVFRDPCFEARYFAKYRDGRVRALNNIYEAGMSQCYVEQLEQLEVKANLIVPIMIEGKLFGLLVAHQCSVPRQWQQSEILWLTQITTQIGFALDNAQLLADAQRIRQQAESEKMWTEYFTDAVQQIRQSLKQSDILQASVREVRRILNCDRVVVYALDQDSYGKIVAESVVHGWTRAEGRVIKDPCFEAKYLEQYRDGRVRAWENIYEAGMSQCYVEQLANLEVKANLVTPIIHQGELLGLLVAHQCSDTRQCNKLKSAG
jgi:methyl-accepting chemotaxis protein PixJ